MDDPTQTPLSPALNIVGAALIGGCALVWLLGLVWLLVVQRSRRRQGLIPYEKRRQVPWRGGLVLVAFLVLEAPLLLALSFSLFGLPKSAGPPPGPSAKQVDTEHDVLDLLSADSSLTAWLLAGLIVVIVAPIVEEFMYRLLLQGWLEAEERRARRLIPALRRLFPGAVPIVAVSLLFALRHFRPASAPSDIDELKLGLLLHAFWSLLAFVLALGVLRAGSDATAEDLGFVPEKFWSDVVLGLVVCVAVTAPIFFLQQFLTTFVFPSSMAADPVPLFFLALALGFVYYRTHRIVPAIVIHMAFNGIGLALAWLQLQAGAAG